MSMNKKSFTVDVPTDVSTAFSEHIEDQGYTKWKAIMGAIKAYMVLPPEVQVFVNNPNTTVKQARKKITDCYADKLRLELLGKLTPGQQMFLMETAKETARRLSQKG